MIASSKIRTLTFSVVAMIIFLQSLYCSVACQVKQTPQNLQRICPSANDPNGGRLAALRPEKVKMLHFYGMTFLRFSNNPVETRDPVLIRRFIHALQHPVQQSSGKEASLLNKSDTLEIYLKSAKKGVNLEPLEYRFFGRTQHPARDCFGPEFVAALTTLGRSEAKRYASLAKKLRGQVRTITTYDRKKYVTRNKSKIAQFLTALQFLDKRSCAYGSLYAVPFVFDLELKGGKKQEIDLLIPETVMHKGKGRQQPIWWYFMNNTN